MSQDVSARAIIREMEPPQLQEVHKSLIDKGGLHQLSSEELAQLAICYDSYYQMTGEYLRYDVTVPR